MTFKKWNELNEFERLGTYQHLREKGCTFGSSWNTETNHSTPVLIIGKVWIKVDHLEVEVD